MKTKLVFVALTFACLTTQQLAQAKCRSEDVETPKGTLSHLICRDDQKRYTHQISLSGRALLKGEFFSEETNSKSRLLWVYSGKPLIESGCPDRVYLLDLTSKTPQILQFGVKNACNEFHWVSWGEKRSVIALKKNVSFVYENGKLTPPPAGAKLWNDIEAPHAGEGLKEEDAIPFVEELKLP